MANCLAQTEALLRGKDAGEVQQELLKMDFNAEQVNHLTPHRVFPGNRPSNSILLDRLDPKTLGALIAAYEHKVFVQGIIWNLNSFDQWGVELGKQLAPQILADLAAGLGADEHDSSTRRLIGAIARRHGGKQ